ncbi:MAG: hypothetical protein DDT37_01879 [Firmicutes bacterium]|nr:hypothetical protein [candidate division NPL-UPA2 bacterium]
MAKNITFAAMSTILTAAKPVFRLAITAITFPMITNTGPSAATNPTKIKIELCIGAGRLLNHTTAPVIPAISAVI